MKKEINMLAIFPMLNFGIGYYNSNYVDFPDNCIEGTVHYILIPFFRIRFGKINLTTNDNSRTN